MRTRNLIFNTCFALNCLLVFLLLVEKSIRIPAWLQVAGRLHPLLVHFPIVLLLLCLAWLFWIKRKIASPDTAARLDAGLLLITAFSSALTAIFGLFLSREAAYDADALQWHKYGGAFMSMLTLAWYAFRQWLERKRIILAGMGILALAAIVVTGHLGANITHGDNYLLAPLQKEKKAGRVLLEDAELYKDMVRPVLQSKCMSCHNNSKAKGDLNMENLASLLKGGKNGPLWDTAAAGFGLLLTRIHLPETDKKHMPPQGKPQLTEMEMAILQEWIKAGSDTKAKITDLPEAHPLRTMAKSLFKTVETDDYDFSAAADSKIKALNNNYRLVYPMATGSPALEVEFFGAAAFSSKALKELLEVKEQIVSLHLNKMPVKDEDLATIARMKNLRRLNLSFTQISGAALSQLLGLKALKQLSLSGTKIRAADLQPLSALPELRQLFIWNTGITGTEAAALLARKKDWTIETGFRGDTLTLQLTPPILQNEEQIIHSPIALKLKHYIQGATIHYTLDGSEPDSLQSPVYNNDVTISRNLLLKARAYKTGWLSSPLLENYFYAAKFRADSILHLQPVDPQYKGEKQNVLIDLKKGDLNFRSGKWQGFRQNRMEAVLYFQQAVAVSSITISSLIDIGAYIMPPQRIEVYGGNQPGQWQPLATLTPAQPAAVRPAYLNGYELKFTPASYQYLRLVLIPVSPLPAWHPGKGDKGWIFVDELFVN